MTDDTTVDTAAAAPVDQAPAPAPAAPTAVDVARAVLDSCARKAPRHTPGAATHRRRLRRP